MKIYWKQCVSKLKKIDKNQVVNKKIKNIVM